MMDIQEIPDWWALCPGYGCEKAEDCLRNMAFRDVRKGTTRWMCVLPEAMKDGECSYFQWRPPRRAGRRGLRPPAPPQGVSFSGIVS